jgi:hypothetical protein
MLIEVITFEIRNFNTGTAEEFCIVDTELNYSMVASHPKTRGISFKSMFDFEFTHKQSVPKFIRFGAAVADAFENEIEIDEVDEMVGMYV